MEAVSDLCSFAIVLYKSMPNGGSIVKDDRRGKRIIDIGALVWKRYIKLLIEYLLRRYAPTSVTLKRVITPRIPLHDLGLRIFAPHRRRATDDHVQLRGTDEAVAMQ